MKKNFWSFGPLVLSSLLLAGCSTTITNLTPSTLERSANGFYPFEVELDTALRGIRTKTLQPYVLIGSQSYLMQQNATLKQRWETLVPIPADKEYVSYQYKFNYDYNRVGSPEASSKLSAPYQVRIVDK
jgi:hypothetical protein